MINVACKIADEPAERSQPEVPSQWFTVLGEAARLLSEISGSTETEFLTIGSRLQDFYGRASSILEMSNEVVRLVASDEVENAINGLREILRLMNDYLAHAEHETAESSTTFGTILDQLERVAQPLAGFKKINKSLSMLGISTKIESARLGQSAAGFDTLANDVSKLSVQVTDKSDTITGQKEQLAGLIRQTLARVVSSATQQRHTTGTVLDKTHESLSVLNDVNSRCSAAASVISGVSAEVTNNIGEVVTSLQFHDISRQQMEHVQETLQELCDRLSGSPTDRTEFVRDAGDLCELQAAQLEHARDEINSAVNSIISNLRAVVTQESRLSDETRGIAGVADKADGSFFTDMEADLAVVAEALGQTAEENRNLSTAMNHVAGTVGNIARFVGDIENIGEEIELIALNAQIKAARTGSEGAALGVLAEAIQRLSHETRVHTTVVSEALRSITEYIEGLCSGVDQDTASMDAEVGRMVADLKGLLLSLRQVSGNLLSLLGRMNNEVTELSHDIAMATGGITVHETVAQVLSRVIGDLNGVIREARALVPADSGKERAERLREVAGRYTMHSERKIHASFSGIQGNRVAQAAAGPAVDDLGDNVELF